MRALIVVVATAMLAGCAGSQSHMRLLEVDNALSVQPATAEGYDYIVSVRNVLDIGYNPDDKATRDATAMRFITVQCPNGEIVGEDVIETGKYLGGRQARTYAIHIKCNKA